MEIKSCRVKIHKENEDCYLVGTSGSSKAKILELNELINIIINHCACHTSKNLVSQDCSTGLITSLKLGYHAHMGSCHLVFKAIAYYHANKKTNHKQTKAQCKVAT